MSTKKIYDLTPEQRKIALWRDAKRKQLRELYLRDSAHPTKSLLFDTGIYRYAASKASIEQHFVPTLIRFVSRVGMIASFVIITAVTLKNRKDKKEHLYRTGQIDYASRSHRFC
ncbi:hypothetical protein ALC56_15058 [Trachymyrmex septentrionalis]|uniref:NADH dehydrogenase [ubiquinone] 1 beta subcomplex subunit 4 n=1 Tax=Trachymyrmex septentrionalis TaxID=34720 RepID=A0A151JTD4_9HYME|nr:PREDICTED: uncharacterized protein LOC108756124 [Trachymyrmex septentrionalis]KYN30637.1 hypothetical protein ALC56_15058 [Trachymyrmex septentrionalis]